MQRTFFIEFSGDCGNINQFLGKTGKIISATPQKVGGDGGRGRIFVVADDGKGEDIGL